MYKEQCITQLVAIGECYRNESLLKWINCDNNMVLENISKK